MADEETLRQALVGAAQDMAAGMLRHPDEAQVLADLSPANKRLHVQPDFLATARRSMFLARRTEPDVAITYVLGAIPKTVLSIERQLPAIFEDAVREASVTSVDGTARGLADFVVTSTFVQLLPVFERAAAEDPRPEEDYIDVLLAIRGYIQTVDMTAREVGPMVDELQSRLKQAGVDDWRLSSTSMLAAGAFRDVLQVAFAGRLQFTFIDGRVIRGGDEAGRDWFRESRGSGVLRLSGGGFVAWMGGMSEGRRTLAAATAAAGLYLLGIRA